MVSGISFGACHALEDNKKRASMRLLTLFLFLALLFAVPPAWASEGDPTAGVPPLAGTAADDPGGVADPEAPTAPQTPSEDTTLTQQAGPKATDDHVAKPEAVLETDKEAVPAAQTAPAPTVLYLDGAKGDDANDGLSKEKPLRSFAKAKELAAENQAIMDIRVLGTVPVEGEVSLSGTSAKLIRGEGFTGYLLKVAKGTEASFADIIIDGAGGGELVSSLVYVEGGSLKISHGAILENNKSTLAYGKKHSSEGGGIYAREATLEMVDGIIRNNQASYGGGIFLTDSSQFTMNGGEISGNRAHRYTDTSVSQIYAAGGGVLIYNNAKMIFNDGRIVNNRADEIGGGISVGGADWSRGHATLEMNGGLVDGNEAGASGGGIFIQAGISDDYAIARISAGTITHNHMKGYGWTNKAFGGGGIYVNGMPKEYYGVRWSNGQLHLEKAIITDNEARLEGAGFAACPISKTYIYVTDGVALYGNHTNLASVPSDPVKEITSSDLYIYSDLNYPIHAGLAEYDISDRMLGGQAYRWKHRSGALVKPEELKGTLPNRSSLHYYADQKLDDYGKSLATVLISGNTSATRGGGIGSNGTAFFGKGVPPTDLEVQKTWAEGLTPEPIEIELRGRLNGEDWLIEKVELNPANGFKHTFTGLPAAFGDNKIEDVVYIKELHAEKYQTTVSPMHKPNGKRLSFDAHRPNNDLDMESLPAVYFNEHVNHPETGVVDLEAWELKDFKINIHLVNEAGEQLAEQAMTYQASSYHWNTKVHFDVDGLDVDDVQVVYDAKPDGAYYEPWLLDYTLKLERKGDYAILHVPRLWPMNVENLTGEEKVIRIENLKLLEGDKLLFRIDIKNEPKPLGIDIPVEKRWIGPEAPSVEVELLRDDAPIAKATLTKANSWKHVFKGLALKDPKDSHLYRYSVRETKLAGYIATITGDAAKGFVITNRKDNPPPTPPGGGDSPKKKRISVQKTWIGTPTKEITVHLLANGERVKSITLSPANGWHYTFEDLLKESDGKLIRYTVEEERIPGYTAEITGDADFGYEITNREDHPPTPPLPPPNKPPIPPGPPSEPPAPPTEHPPGEPPIPPTPEKHVPKTGQSLPLLPIALLGLGIALGRRKQDA